MSASPRVVLIAVTKRGLDMARLLRTRLRTGDVHRPRRYGRAAHSWEHLFDGALAGRVPDLFARADQLVLFLATGAVTRLIAPCLSSKRTDPGVLAVDEAGQFVVPVLSGHQGGANAFARTVAGHLGAIPVITTASDVIGGLSLDLLEQAFAWTAEPAERLKSAARALVDGEPTAFVQEIGTSQSWLDQRELPENVTLVPDAGQLAGDAFTNVLWISDRLVEHPSVDGERVLWYRPKSLVVGIGCERGITLEALRDGLERVLRKHRYAWSSIDTLASLDVKQDEEALVALAREQGWRTVFYSADELARVTGAPNPSAVVARCVGTPGVAEPAALLAAGAEALLVEKQVITSSLGPQRMTFALARRAEFQTASRQGKVIFIGAGPGDPELLTLKARRALQRAAVVVYAGSLIPEEVVRCASATAPRHNSASMTLEEVMAILIRSARAGKTVARLQSGDTSIYSAIQEQMTLLDEAGIDYEVIPGISSFQAAAAALKAELTLPESVQTIILTRAAGKTPMPHGEALEQLARHRSTLCIFLSATLAAKIERQLLTAYPPTTPVAILHRVSWPDEKIIVTELGKLRATIRANRLTRTTLILVGEAIAGRKNRSRLYDATHGHIFRSRSRDKNGKASSGKQRKKRKGKQDTSR